MTASDLRDWIALFMMELTPDGAGGSYESVPQNLVPDIPANVRQLAASETAAGDQTMADRARYEITIRYEPGITGAYRVMWRDLLLDIDKIENVDMRDTWLKLGCVRKEAGEQ
jgi:head-tail adaptor